MKNALELSADMPPLTSSQPYYGDVDELTYISGTPYLSCLFRCLPGINHRYLYQIQETHDAINWSDINHYTDVLTGFPNAVGTGTTAHSTFQTASSTSAFLSVPSTYSLIESLPAAMGSELHPSTIPILTGP
jgi:hypothetical protein